MTRPPIAHLVGTNLQFAYGDANVLDVRRIHVTSGRVTALVGPSGSGKTTLLWLLAGLHRPGAGRVVQCGDPSDPGVDGKPLRERGPVGMVFQQPALWDHLTVRGHMDLVLRGRGLDRRARHERADRVLARLRLSELARRRPAQLSGGQQQRVALARALAIQPRWLLLDEPLAHLDGPGRDDLLALLTEILSECGAGVLVATHLADEALRLADDVAVLCGGRVIQQGPCEQVYRHPVDLHAARALGPAAEFAGHAECGKLIHGGQVLLAGLDPGLSGMQRLLLRPEELHFEPDAEGSARVRRCAFTGRGYQSVVAVARITTTVRHTPQSVPIGTRGTLQRR